MMNPRELLVALRAAKRQIDHVAAALDVDSRRVGAYRKRDAVAHLHQLAVELAGTIYAAERYYQANPPLGIADAVRAAVREYDADDLYPTFLGNDARRAVSLNATGCDAAEDRERRAADRYRFIRDELGDTPARIAEIEMVAP